MKYGEINLEGQIFSQVNFWSEIKDKEEYKIKPFITISREFGCEGLLLAEKLAEELQKAYKESKWSLFDKNVLEKIVEDHKISERLFKSFGEEEPEDFENLLRDIFSIRDANKISIYRKVSYTIRNLARKGFTILVGRGGVFITKGLPYGIHIRIVADEDWKVEKAMKEHNLSRMEAKKYIKDGEDKRRKFIKEFFGKDISSIYIYDMVLNNAKMNVDDMVGAILGYMRAKKYLL